jgi:FkbM family methyltransferase
VDLGRKKRQFDPAGFINRARHHSAPEPDKDLHSKMDESLRVIDMIKNGMTVTTGQYEALTRLFTGQKIYVDTRDISIAPHLMLDGVWEEEFTRIIRPYFKPDSVFFDVGANFGYYGLLAGTAITNQGSIHFFEPNPLLADLISKSVSVNGLLHRASVVQKAVGSQQGQLTLNIPGTYFGSATVTNDRAVLDVIGDDKLQTVRVDQTSLDDYARQKKLKRVDVMKIDVEGFEEMVYDGMSHIIKTNPDLVVFLEFTSRIYKDAAGFFKKIKRDFENLYMVDDGLYPVEKVSDLDEVTDRDGFATIAMSNNRL